MPAAVLPPAPTLTGEKAKKGVYRKSETPYFRRVTRPQAVELDSMSARKDLSPYFHCTSYEIQMQKYGKLNRRGGHRPTVRLATGEQGLWLAGHRPSAVQPPYSPSLISARTCAWRPKLSTALYQTLAAK